MTYLEVYPHPSFESRSRLFHEKYECLHIIGEGNDAYSKRKLKKAKERFCIFCGKGYPSVKFNHFSHLLPQLIGNGDLYSDFECDVCNERFSRYENDFAEFLGVSNSISGVGSGKKPKGFAGRKLKAKSRSFIGEHFLIIAPEDIQQVGNTKVITYTKNPYTPANVYKTLVKCAVSLLAPLEKGNLNAALSYLNAKLKVEKGAIINGYKLAFSIDMPLHVFVFKKRNNSEPIATYILSFYFKNHIITLPFPFLPDDLKTSQQGVNIIIPPPFFANQQVMAEVEPSPFSVDLSSEDRVVDEEEIIHLEIDDESLKNSCYYDPVSDTLVKAEYNPQGTKFIVLMKDGVSIDPKGFSKFLNTTMNQP